MFKDVLLRTRRVMLLYKVCDNSALLVLNGTSLNSDNALLGLGLRLHDCLCENERWKKKKKKKSKTRGKLHKNFTGE